MHVDGMVAIDWLMSIVTQAEGNDTLSMKFSSDHGLAVLCVLGIEKFLGVSIRD